MARNAVDPKAFLDIENALTGSMLRDWVPEENKTYKAIVNDVADNLMDAALARVNEINAAPNIVKRTKAMQTFGMAAVLFGARRARLNEQPTTFEQSGITPEMLNISTRIMGLGINEAVEQIHKSKARNLLNQWDSIASNGQFRIEKARPKLKPDSVAPEINDLDDPNIDFGTGFADQFMGIMRKSDVQLFSLASSLHVSRMAQWGFLVEAQRQNVAFFEVDEVLDSRTCAVCRQMDGKVFPVSSARSRVEFSMTQAADGADVLKVIAPWSRQTPQAVGALSEMSSSELIQRGMDTPPYHPYCRGVLKRTTKTSEAGQLPSSTGGSFLGGLLSGGLISSILSKPEEAQQVRPLGTVDDQVDDVSRDDRPNTLIPGAIIGSMLPTGDEDDN